MDPQGRSLRGKLNNICMAILCCVIYGKRNRMERFARCKLLGIAMSKILARHQVKTRMIEWNWRILLRILEKHNDNMENYGQDGYRVLPHARMAAKEKVKLFLHWARDGFDEVIDGEEERRLNRILRHLDPDEGRMRLNVSFLLNAAE
jgi:hypothetical protein